MQSSKRFLDIPGEDTFIGTFQFKLEPPVLPVPFAKTLVYPLDGERYTKPHLTSFFYKATNRLLAPVDLDVPVDHINMASDQYNTPSGTLDPAEAMLLNETVQKQSVPRKKSSIQLRKSSQQRPSIEYQEESMPSQTKQSVPLDYSLERLQSLVQQSFSKSEQIKPGIQHPSRPIRAKNVYRVLPNFTNIEQQFTMISGMELLGEQNEAQFVLQKTQDIDTQQILQYFKRDNKEQEQENKDQDQQSFRHHSNIIYKEIDLNIGKIKKHDYLLQLMPGQEQACLCYIKDNFILRKKKFSKNELEQQHSVQDRLVIRRVEYDREEIYKRKHMLQEMGYPVSQELREQVHSMKEQERLEKQDKTPVLVYRQDIAMEEEWQFDVKKEEHQSDEPRQEETDQREEQEEEEEELDLSFDENDFEE